MMTEAQNAGNESAPHLSMRSMNAAFAAEPEKGLVKRRGSVSGGNPIAAHTGDTASAMRGSAPDTENIEIAVIMRTSDGISPTAVRKAFDAPSVNASERSFFPKTNRRAGMRRTRGIIREDIFSVMSPERPMQTGVCFYSIPPIALQE